jgi:hypothetical protein
MVVGVLVDDLGDLKIEFASCQRNPFPYFE